MTTRWRHRWYKVFPMEDLFGEIRYRLSPAERGVWYDLRNLAGISAVPGVVCDDLTKAHPHKYLAYLMNVQIALVENTLKKITDMGLCTEDKTGIHIPHWEERQSEYDRQKPYRETKKEVDPDKFVRGKYGHMVAQSSDDVKRIKGE